MGKRIQAAKQKAAAAAAPETGGLSLLVAGGGGGPSQSPGFAAGGTIIIIVGLLVLYIAVTDKFNCFSGLVNCLLERKPPTSITGGSKGGGFLGAAGTASGIAGKILKGGFGFF